MRSGVMGAGESNYLRAYKRLGESAKLATTYMSTTVHGTTDVEMIMQDTREGIARAVTSVA